MESFGALVISKAARPPDIQERIWASGGTVYLDQFELPVVCRCHVKGVIVGPLQFFWNISVGR